MADGRTAARGLQTPREAVTVPAAVDDEEAPDLSSLPAGDNTSEALAVLRRANAHYRRGAWPEPFSRTRHHLRLGDARDLSWVADRSVELVVTSPPYWTLKKYEDREGQLGDVADYEGFLDQLDKVWNHCERVLVEGGRICCVVGDVCVPRKKGRHQVFPLHADIMVRARRLGLDCVTGIVWQKIANGVTEAEGNGAGFYGKPYQPNAVIKNDAEYILFLRKPGAYRSVSPMKKALSMLTREEMQAWFRSIWSDVKGASTRDGHPAPYPVELAERLIRMFSFAGDTVLDPFLGTGSTSLAAAAAGRNSIGNEIEPKYLRSASRRLQDMQAKPRLLGATMMRIETEMDGVG
jgi:modification methylase